jgi:hypothetical protein
VGGAVVGGRAPLRGQSGQLGQEKVSFQDAADVVASYLIQQL